MKKIGIILSASVIAGILGLRIWQVNKNVEPPEVKNWQIGEMVPLEKNYFLEEYEICDGYEIRVNRAELLTYEEFLKRYSSEDSKKFIYSDDIMKPNYIYDINVTFRNTNKEALETGIDLGNYYLCATDYFLQVTSELYALANSEKRNTSLRFSLLPESELDFQLPFGIWTEAEGAYLTMDALEQRNLYLLASLYPVQNQILIHKK